MILLHGFFMDSRMFKHQVEKLSSDYRVITIDLRGFGQTKWTHEPFSLYDYVDDIISIANSLHIKEFILGGMSMGGYIALRLALKHQDRVKALLLMDTQADRDNQETIESFKQLRDNWVNKTARAQIIDSLLPIIIGHDLEEAAFWRSVWMNYSSDSIKYPMNAMLERDDIDVSKISAPALILHGSDDLGIPITLGKKLYKSLPNSYFISVPQGHHASIMINHEYCNNTIIAFLQNIK
ncbi:alpha/beta hydrolase (plasmid) [Photobacterium damselae subsp. damselae]|uniref:alpha/beta fold hydrolase n=1 Tax=Photobacterium damselae TaxID=38293 RepID=UPI001F326C43|nr:alpha/beta hydrolase [Photobacterium damselae subsp. damselae]